MSTALIVLAVFNALGFGFVGAIWSTDGILNASIKTFMVLLALANMVIALSPVLLRMLPTAP